MRPACSRTAFSTPGRPRPRSPFSHTCVKSTLNRIPPVGMISTSSERRDPNNQPCRTWVSSFTPFFNATAASAANRPTAMLATAMDVCGPK
ncbi:MAG: hypothetical protein QM724_08170 [Flavobacteriales bacterium]